VKHLNCKLYYQELHLKYLCNLVRYWLQAPWRWHDSVETCSSVIICKIIVHLLVRVKNNKQPIFYFLLLWEQSKIFSLRNLVTENFAIFRRRIQNFWLHKYNGNTTWRTVWFSLASFARFSSRKTCLDETFTEIKTQAYFMSNNFF
jgi:hypothetical protein